MCNRPAARPDRCSAALVSLMDGRSVEAFFHADAGSPGDRDLWGCPLTPDEGPSVELVDVQLLGMSLLDTLTEDDLGYIVDQLLGLNAPAPAPILARRPSGPSFAEEARELQQAIAMQKADGEETDCDTLPFPRLPIAAFPEPPRAA